MAVLTRLKAIREAQFLTQQELADRSGVSRVAISRIESGDVEPRFSNVRKLAKALGVEPAALVGSPPSPS